MGEAKLGRALRRQIDRIWVETAKRKGLRAADSVVTRIAEVVAMLGRQPESGVPGTRRGRAMRRFLAGEYWIYYVTGPGGARVRKIRHFKQDQSKDWDATNG